MTQPTAHRIDPDSSEAIRASWDSIEEWRQERILVVLTRIGQWYKDKQKGEATNAK